MKSCLIIVDIQYDFLPGGKLPVKDGDQVIPVINSLQDKFELVVATQDWHPDDHQSFAANHSGRKPGDVIVIKGVEQVLWPQHCIQNSRGARLAESLRKDKIAAVFHKGTERTIDSYSTFFDNAHRRETGLDHFLQQHSVNRVYLAGLATDYCVKYSAHDAVSLRYETFVVIDACRGIDLVPGDIQRSVKEMQAAGVNIVTSDQIK